MHIYICIHIYICKCNQIFSEVYEGYIHVQVYTHAHINGFYYIFPYYVAACSLLHGCMTF